MNTVTQELLKRELLDPTTAQQAENAAARNRQSVVGWLLEQGHCPEDRLAAALAEHLRLPLLELSAVAIQRSPVEVLDEKILRSHQCLPLWYCGSALLVAVADPCRNDLIADLKFHTGKHVELAIVEQQTLQTMIEELLEEGDAGDYVDKALHEEATLSLEHKAGMPLTADLDDKPLVRFVNRLLGDAIRVKASDIHFEPYETYYRVRFRRDGKLYEVTRPPLNMAGRLASRLKVMAQLDISERRSSQDGRIRWQFAEDRNVDFRVSVLPTLWGEKLVLRNLDTAHRRLNFDSLGLDGDQHQQFRNVLMRSQGLILVTGPTGSGKTQTLYTGIQLLNKADRNIATVEDPVEFNIDGVNQVAVNHKSELSFAQVLRALLRQDPDILMIGEIRDSETAEIAIKAAQTGHLVLATLHSNDALGALDRLAGMGIAAYNLAAACSLLMAQRLLRKLCKYCKEPLQLPASVLVEQGFNEQEIPQLSLHQASGCERCHGGYQGRIGIYDVVPVTDELSRHIMSGKHSQDLIRLIGASAVSGLRRSALSKVARGITSLEEANRLT